MRRVSKEGKDSSHVGIRGKGIQEEGTVGTRLRAGAPRAWQGRIVESEGCQMRSRTGEWEIVGEQTVQGFE